MSDRTSTFADRILALKEVFGSQRSLARWLQVTPQALIGWRAGSEPLKSTLWSISQNTGLDYEWLESGAGNQAQQLAIAAKAAKDQNQPGCNDGARGMLKRALEDAGMSVKELARRTRYAVGVLQAVKEGNARISENMAIAICRELPSLTVEDLLSGSDLPRVIEESGAHGDFGAKPDVTLPGGMKARYVPLLSFAQAGQYALGSVDEHWTGEAFLALDVSDGKAFALKITGDSMSPHIGPGDTTVVCPSWTPRRGDTVVVKMMDSQVFCKVWTGTKGDIFTFTSHNPAHPDLEISREEIAWIYPVAQVTKSLRRQS